MGPRTITIASAEQDSRMETQVGMLLRIGVLSSAAVSSSVIPIKVRPNESRFPQRWIEATQSRASTGVPSWNFRPLRRPMRTSLPSSSLVRPAQR